MDMYEKDLEKNVEFWRFLRIGESELDHVAEVGDILLCETQKKYRKNSENNKINLICTFVRLQSETIVNKTELFVLRVGPNLNNGVLFQPWEEFRIYAKLYLSICYFRHLKIKRDSKFLNKAQYFVQQIMQKPIVTIDEELNKNASLRNKNKIDKRLYRNAELIAKFYKFIKILPNES